MVSRLGFPFTLGLSTLFNLELTQEYECGPPTMKPGKGDHPTYKTRHFSTLNSIHPGFIDYSP
jgi:hypothetical protein